jgi:hypothetical protein
MRSRETLNRSHKDSKTADGDTGPTAFSELWDVHGI